MPLSTTERVQGNGLRVILLVVPGGAPATTWYKDANGDGYGDPAAEVVCVDDPSAPGNLWVADNSDCDDTNGNANPSELETADRVDNDYDGEVDNGFKYAFVTSSTHTGNLGGLAGADAICDGLAAWKNWGQVLLFAYWLFRTILKFSKKQDLTP